MRVFGPDSRRLKRQHAPRGGDGNEILVGGTQAGDGTDTILGGADRDLLLGHRGGDVLGSTDLDWALLRLAQDLFSDEQSGEIRTGT